MTNFVEEKQIGFFFNRYISTVIMPQKKKTLALLEIRNFSGIREKPVKFVASFLYAWFAGGSGKSLWKVSVNVFSMVTCPTSAKGITFILQYVFDTVYESSASTFAMNDQLKKFEVKTKKW